MKKLVGAVAGVAVALMAQNALTLTNPYTGQGSDISWPQCGKTYPAVAFGIVGIDHGRPFDPDNQYGPNTCLASEYRWAQQSGRADLYLNTGYDPSYYANHSIAACTTQMASHGSDATHQQAWEVGCATAWINYSFA